MARVNCLFPPKHQSLLSLFKTQKWDHFSFFLFFFFLFVTKYLQCEMICTFFFHLSHLVSFNLFFLPSCFRGSSSLVVVQAIVYDKNDFIQYILINFVYGCSAGVVHWFHLYGGLRDVHRHHFHVLFDWRRKQQDHANVTCLPPPPSLPIQCSQCWICFNYQYHFNIWLSEERLLSILIMSCLVLLHINRNLDFLLFSVTWRTPICWSSWMV